MKLVAIVTLSDAATLAVALWQARAVVVVTLITLALAILWLDSQRHRRGCGVAADLLGALWVAGVVVGFLLL